MQENKEIIIITGHYGCGKTNIAINLALDYEKQGFRTALVDLDIVNPYFRAFDSEKMLTDKNIKVIAPTFANTNLDVPSLPAEINTIFSAKYEKVVVDVGGDDAGAIALGRYANKLKEFGYELLYVVSMYRPLTKEPAQAVEYLSAIEKVSGLKATAIINNSSLGEITTAEDIKASFSYANEVSRLVNLPLKYNIVARVSEPEMKNEDKVKIIDLYTKTLW